MTSEPKERVALLQGTLDLIVLRALDTMGHSTLRPRRAPRAGRRTVANAQSRHVVPALVGWSKGWIKGACGELKPIAKPSIQHHQPGVRALHKQPTVAGSRSGRQAPPERVLRRARNNDVRPPPFLLSSTTSSDPDERSRTCARAGVAPHPSGG